jgi:hypothetical protein
MRFKTLNLDLTCRVAISESSKADRTCRVSSDENVDRRSMLAILAEICRSHRATVVGTGYVAN